MPSKTQKNQSAGELEHQSTDSVFDFLYYDSRRVGSFLSQFDDFGHLQTLSRKEGVQKGKSEVSNVEAAGGMPGVAQAKGNYQHGTSSGNQHEALSTYDPYWSNALSLLDYLQEKGMLYNGIRSARIGQLALFSGTLAVRDLRLIQKAMALPAMKGIVGGNQTQPSSRQSRHNRRRDNAPESSDVSGLFGIEMFSLLPHSVQMEFQTDDCSVWATLQEESLVVSSSDLFLKHGVSVPGVWHVLGVVDALPTVEDDPDSALANLQTAEANIPGDDFGNMATLAMKGFAGFIDGLVPFAKLLLGRRDHQYGVTPLLVFRQVAK